MRKVYIESYGCSANHSDTEIMLGLLREKGFKIVNTPKISNINIINTCVVKTPTENRMIFRVKELSKLNKPLIVAGCMPKVERRVIERINPHVSLIGPNSVEKIVHVVEETLEGKKVVFLGDSKKPKLCLPRVRKNPVIHICQISSGCLSACSFCIVKNARGSLLSYPPELIIKEIKKSLKEGCKEIWITSQDCGCWGKDINSSLPELLFLIDKIERNFFVRVGMMNPMHVKDMVDELIESFRSEKIFKFFHLPVQSGSNRILNRMNRNYSVNDFKRIVKRIKDEFPFSTISTDVIVGFPGERKIDFEKTVKLLKEIKPDVVNISKFGPRPGTLAASMKGLPRKIIDERTKYLTKIVERIKLKNNEKWLGWKGKVLVDEKGKKNMMGRNLAYKPIVMRGRIGTFKEVKITEVRSTYLIGELI